MTVAPVPAAIPASDENTHEPTSDPQFNESVYFNFVDQAGSGLASLIRMGNRVNEGHSEVTVLVYLPDGSVAAHIERAPISDNSEFVAGGLRIEVLEPLKRVRVSYAGDAHHLATGPSLADPKKAFTESPVVPLALDLECTTIGQLYGLSGTADGAGGIEGGEDTIAVAHYEGGIVSVGTVNVAGLEHRVEASGFRDHSWGPRKWTAPSWWRWVSCWVDADNGFAGFTSRVGDNRAPGTGAVVRDGKVSLVRRMEIKSTYGEAPTYFPQRVDAILTTDDDRLEVQIDTFPNAVPLRHRREGYHARIAEVLGRFEFDGRVGYGFLEYHDLLVDGVPRGIAEV
jgi:hypothetical protein